MKLVILDRDGVINRESAEFVKDAAEWHALPGSLDAMAAFTLNGFRVAVATNQSGIGRGLFGYQQLAQIHCKMLRELALLGGRVDGLFFCPHAPDDGCDCRKPGTGLYEQIAAYFGVPLSGVPAIGDSERDLAAADAAGARPVLVRTGNGARTEAGLTLATGVPVYDDLAAAAAAIISESCST